VPHVIEISEQEQELLEALWQQQIEGVPLKRRVVDEALLAGLSAKGWTAPDGHNLTGEGQELARRAIRRHRLAERLIADLMGDSGEGAEEEACVLEHSLLEGLAEKVCTFLGHPRVCPHGHPIPEGACCRKDAQTVVPAVTPLGQLAVGETGSIAYLSTGQEGDLQKFLAMGVHPGDSITLVRKTPTVVFRCGHSQFAVDRDLASQVYVRRAS
jgi:DtxR family transcriptional regulator, Mn-dependent transcriptional regulator